MTAAIAVTKSKPRASSASSAPSVASELARPKEASRELAGKILRCLAARERGGRNYKRADRLLDELAAAVTPGEEILLNQAGRKAVLVDLYAERNVVFKPCGVRRYELKIIEP